MRFFLLALFLICSLSAQETAISEEDIVEVPEETSGNYVVGRREAPSGGFYTKAQAEQKVKTYTKLKKSGARRAIIGTSLTTLGIILFASADKETTSTSTGTQTTTNDPKGIIGMTMILPGIPIGITGLVQLAIGSTKVEEYQNLFNDTQVGMTIGKDQLGLMVTHAF